MFTNFPVWVISVYAAFIWVALCPFGFYHWLLICRNRTTNEEVRNRYQRWGRNPFDQGVRKNCSNYWKAKPSAVFDPHFNTD